MSRTVRAVNGLFDWLKTDEADGAAVPSNDTQIATENRVVALRQELFEAAQAQLAGAQNAQEMIALLDALRVAEQTPGAPVTHEAALPADDFGTEPATAARIEEDVALDHVGTMPDWQGHDAFGTTIRDLPSEGWLIDALHMVESEAAAPRPAGTVFTEGSVLEGRWTVEAHALPNAESQLSELVIETDNRSELPNAESLTGEAEPRVIDVPTGPSVGERAAALAAPMMIAFLGGAQRARKTAVNGASRVNDMFVKQRAAAQRRAEARETARQEAAAVALEQLAQNRAEAARAELARMEAARQIADMPLPLATSHDFAMPQVPQASDSGYSHEAVEALLSIPETRWSSPAAAATHVTPLVEETSEMPEWLEEKLALHVRWLESNGTEGKRYRYNGEDFSGANLSGRSLVQAQMRGAMLAGIDLSGARLDGADFSEADLSRTVLTDARATRTVFARANLTFADMNGMHAPAATFNFADLQGAKMKDAMLEGAQLREANLQGVVAPEVRLSGANMRGVRLFESILPGADLRGADLRGAHLERTVFIGTLLAGASLKDAEIHDLDYAQTDFTVALDVPQEMQLAALGAERAKLNEARASLEARFATMQMRESRMLANLRVLEHKRHHDGQFEAQEAAVVEKLEAHVRWLRRGSFWWVGMVALLFGVAWLAMSEVPMASINFPVLGLIASFGVIAVTLATLSFLRIWRIRSSLAQLLKHRQATRAAIAEQAVQEAAGI